MRSEIKAILQNKKILILGFGKEGQSTYRLIRSWFPQMYITIGDQAESFSEGYNELEEDKRVGILSGKGYLDSCNAFDLIIKSPGIPFEKVAEKCEPANLTSQTDLFLKAYASKVTGVTGTKGKSTTASLIHHILLLAGRKAILAGNIGVPPLDLAEKADQDVEVIFEMSSHQLEHIGIAPQTAVILNIFPEHLDHYKDFTAYKMAKFNISRKQPPGGKLVYNADDPILEELVLEQAENKTLLSFSISADKRVNASYDGTQIVCSDEGGSTHNFPLSGVSDLPGTHNVRNIMAAILVCLEKRIKYDVILTGIRTYKRLPHRLEFAGTYHGINFYDDSIATVPEASIEALKTLGRVNLLILGGHDRGLDYTALYTELKTQQIPYLVFMGDAGKRMYDESNALLEKHSECVLIENMADAFGIIRDKLMKGDVCLLSPAAASYGMYKNFEERGEVFKKMAATL